MSALSHFRETTPDEVYPVPPVEIARHLGFCLGNAVLCALCAPYRDGVEDCDKALECLRLEDEMPQPFLGHFAYIHATGASDRLTDFLRHASGDTLWKDTSYWQAFFLDELHHYLFIKTDSRRCEDVGSVRKSRDSMSCYVRELRRVLSLRDTTGQIYEGMTGLPDKPDKEDE